MMKKYIILTGAIRNAGGAQLYTANKLSYMESLGWEPYAFFHVAGDVKISYLNRFIDSHIPEIGRPIQSLKASVSKKIINNMASAIKAEGDDEIIIESNSLSLAFWGEALANSLNAHHVMFPLEESFWNITKKEAEFFQFKLHRKEIMTSTEYRLRQIFQGYYKAEYNQYLLGLRPYCSNVVDYTPIELPDSIHKSNSFKILSIGRLKKAYINPMLQEIKNFANNHNEAKIDLIMVGGDSDPSIEAAIKELYKDVDNVTLYLLGYIFPIPYDWIRISDVCIASSNSVLVSAEEGIPTIAVDGHDLKAIGVYGYTTNKKVFRGEEPPLQISMLLEEILIKKKYPKVLKHRNPVGELASFFQPHVTFLDNIDREKKYYLLSDIYSPIDCFLARLKSYARKRFEI